MGKITFCSLILCCVLKLNAQYKINTIVLNTEKEPISFAIIEVSTKNNSLKHLYADKNGNFSIRVIDKTTLKISALGFQPKKINLDLNSPKKITVTLQEKSFELEEVIIQSKKSIKIGKDTIRIRAKAFSNGTEQNVEDLLSKIPGIQINSEGTIKIGGKEIEKLMIDGDDFFERGYKILSKNMPAHPIKEIEILKNYSNNRLLKGIEKSDKVTLNLKLDEKSKRLWFGNIETQTGNAEHYQTKVDLMNFGKKAKYYFLGNINTLGADVTGDISRLIHPFRYDEPASIGDNEQVQNLLNLSPTNLSFEDNKNHFNNAKLLSLNAICNPTNKLKIKTIGFFNWDKVDFYRTRFENIRVNDLNFSNSEDYVLQNDKRIAFGKIELIYNISKTKMLTSITKYNHGDFTDTANLLFNTTKTNEKLRSKNRLFDQKLNYTNKFGKKKVFLLTGRFINEESPQKYEVNQFYFQNLFSVDADEIKQNSKNKMKFFGVDTHLLNRRKNKDLAEIQIGNEYRKDEFISKLFLFKKKSIALQPNDYNNKTIYNVNDLYLKGKYFLKFKSLGVTTKLDVHQLFNRLETKTKSKQTPFFVNPNITFDWKINNDNKITSAYGYNTKNSQILDVFNLNSLTSYRSFLKGTGKFNQLESSKIYFSYQLGNWSDRFFANTYVGYSKNHDFFSSQILLNKDYTETSKILVKDKEIFTANSRFDYYLRFISSNLKVNLGYLKSDYKNSINQSELRKITVQKYSYGLDLRSAFSGVFNYHIGTKWSENSITTTSKNSYRNNKSFLDLFFIFNKRFDVQFQTEYYHFGNLVTNKNYYFLDTEANYKLIKDKLSFGISGRNLFNTDSFINYSISDISTSTTQYRLLPRIVLLKIKFRL